MKIRIADRIIVGLTGVLLLLLAACAGGLYFGFIPMDTVKQLNHPLIPYIGLAVTALLGIYCLSLLFRRRKGKRGFVQQSSEHGELSISVKAIDALVRKCVEQHPEMKLNSNHVEISGDSVIVHLGVQMASGVSIPLAVGALQKQIHSYVTACTGVEVKEARVQVETTGEQQTSSLYAVPELIAAPAPVKEVTNAVVTDPDEAEQEDRATHQRIFGHDEQPAVVPAPPTVDAPAASEENEPDGDAEIPVAAVDDATASEETEAPAEPVDEETADEQQEDLEISENEQPETVTEDHEHEEI